MAPRRPRPESPPAAETAVAPRPTRPRAAPAGLSPQAGPAKAIVAPSAVAGSGPAGERTRPSGKADRRTARRKAILAAALAEFARNGYAATRLEEVAKGAGVAKGTLYLYFADKEALFRGLVEDKITPVLVDADALLPLFPGSTRDLLEALMEMLIARILDQPAQAILRLMISEGPRFPGLAAYYHRAVISRGIALLRQVAQRALDRGEITSDCAVRFPQLIIAPALLTVVWNSLFGAFDPLDPRPLLRAHRDLLLAGLGWREPA